MFYTLPALPPIPARTPTTTNTPNTAKYETLPQV